MATTRKTADQTFADTNVSRRVLVLIKRDQTTATPRVVWRHEVPILEAIHGEGNVVESDRADLDEGYSQRIAPDMLAYNKREDQRRRPSQTAGIDFAFIGSAEGEYERLASVYGKHPEVNQTWVENIFGRFKSGLFARTLGTAKLADCPPEQLRNLILAWGYALPIATWDSTDDEKRTAAAALDKFQALDHAALVKLAEEVGVELSE